MIMRWLRESVIASILLLLCRLYVGWKWVDAGWHKLTGDEKFDASGFIKHAIDSPIKDQTGHTVYPNYTAFLKHFALPNVSLFNVLVPIGELLVGLGLILGALTTIAAFFGLFMNFMYLLAGTISTNPWLILLGFIILAAGTNAGRIGIDYYLHPYLRRKLFRRKPAYKA